MRRHFADHHQHSCAGNASDRSDDLRIPLHVACAGRRAALSHTHRAGARGHWLQPESANFSYSGDSTCPAYHAKTQARKFLFQPGTNFLMRRLSTWRLVLVSVAIVAMAAFAGERLDGIAATVNGRAIMQSEVQ